MKPETNRGYIGRKTKHLGRAVVGLALTAGLLQGASSQQEASDYREFSFTGSVSQLEEGSMYPDQEILIPGLARGAIYGEEEKPDIIVEDIKQAEEEVSIAATQEEESQVAVQAGGESVPIRTIWPASLQPCGGDLPPCWVADRESSGDYSAVNETGCGGYTCGGKWQFDPRTWGGYKGYAFAQDAPPEIQDEKARILWDGGRGCGHWGACE